MPNEVTCGICLAPFAEGKAERPMVFTLCGKKTCQALVYCFACLDKQLTDGSGKCPMCRTLLPRTRSKKAMEDCGKERFRELEASAAAAVDVQRVAPKEGELLEDLRRAVRHRDKDEESLALARQLQEAETPQDQPDEDSARLIAQLAEEEDRRARERARELAEAEEKDRAFAEQLQNELQATTTTPSNDESNATRTLSDILAPTSRRRPATRNAGVRIPKKRRRA